MNEYTYKNAVIKVHREPQKNQERIILTALQIFGKAMQERGTNEK